MLRGVAILRRIAATDVSAGQTQAKVHPSVARQKAFLAAFAARCDFLNFFNVCAALVQRSTSARILRQSAVKNRAKECRAVRPECICSLQKLLQCALASCVRERESH